MSWLFSQALVAGFSAASCLAGTQSAQSSGNHTQQAFCAPDKTMDFSRLSRFGMTFKPLTVELGEELLTSYLAAFHAKTSALQEKAQESTVSAQECGHTWRASFAKFDPSTFSWRTHQCSLLGGLEEFSETWPAWGLMRDGECWEQQTLEQTIRGTGFGLSPDGVATFHTPNCSGLDGGSNSRKALRKRTETYPTPVARMWKDNASPSEFKRNEIPLAARVGGQLNPTWVEWLMGWPLGWTDLKPLETDKCHSAPQQLSGFLEKKNDTERSKQAA